MVAQPCRTDGSISPRLFISKEVLDIFIISFNIRKKFKADFTSKNTITDNLDDIEKYRASYIDTIFQENLIGSRFKSEDSIKRKYEKTLKTGGGFKQCFNDILGFRLKFEEYPREYPALFSCSRFTKRKEDR